MSSLLMRNATYLKTDRNFGASLEVSKEKKVTVIVPHCEEIPEKLLRNSWFTHIIQELAIDSNQLFYILRPLNTRLR
uniref:Uncharacterized protein n=3 Tax=Enterobacteriaceae TaxID=543 RepID=T2K1L0_ECOLX|nr:conserved hypothetical protein [Escherichia coli]SPE02822.1 Hypothetical protein RCS79_P0161 [Escherichia coli]